VGIGYVNGVREADVRGIVAERERGGPFGSPAQLAGRCATRRDALERLAWAGACDSLVEGVDAADARRRALWLLGVSTPGASIPDGTQLALPLEPAEPPDLPAMSPWERMLADYGSTHVTLREHPLELMRPTLEPDVRSSADLDRSSNGERVRVAGLVVARQRPATAHGVTFILLEDEHGTINLIVPPPVYERCRHAVRVEPVVLASGRLERRDGVTNVVVSDLSRLECPDRPLGEVREIEPGRAWSTDDRRVDELREGAADGDLRARDLGAVAPAAHSFGRRGR
jgi:error-prone DNA polymerase